MANWIVQNCIDPSDIRVSSDRKGQLSPGVVFPAGEMTGTIGCFQVQSETSDPGTISPTGPNNADCVECLVNNNFKLIFRNCSTGIDYYVSPSGIEKLPTLGTVYGGVISEVEGCYEYIGITSDSVEMSSASFNKSFDDCLGCQGGFTVAFEQEILINNTYNLNDVSVLSKTGDFLEPFEYFISEQNKVKDVIIEKGLTLKVGNSTGTLGIMVVDSNNFSATTTTEVLKRPSFTTNRDEIINNVSYQDFKQKNIKDNYNSIIQNRINPQSQEQAK